MNLLHEWWGLLSGLPAKLLGLVGWLIAMAALFGLLERWRPLHRQRFWRRHLWHDIGYYLLGGVLPAYVMVVASGAIVWFASGLTPAAFLAVVGHAPSWLRLAAIIVAGDVSFYWAHRWSHEWPWLWRFHAVHHSPTEMDWLVNTRAHPVDLVVTRAIAVVPILALGLRQGSATDLEPTLAVVLTSTTVWAFFIHANLGWRLGWLEQLIVSPAFHHWHHANDDAATVNKNYAAMLPWLDRLFGTYHLPPATLPRHYGTTTVLADTFAGQLLGPLARAAPAPPRGEPRSP